MEIRTENDFRAAQGLPLLGPNEEVWGLTLDDATHNHYTNYVASDLTNALDTLKSQVHELGHSLALITGIEGNATRPKLGTGGQVRKVCEPEQRLGVTVTTGKVHRFRSCRSQA